MRLFFISLLLALGACSSPSPPTPAPVVMRDMNAAPRQDLQVDRGVHAMNRDEQVEAINECRKNKLRPRVIYSNTSINGKYTPVIVDVLCVVPFSNDF